MKIVIVGAGTVGFTVAKTLSAEGHDVTVVERDQTVAERIKEEEDVAVFCGNGARPATLEQVGVGTNSNVDYLVACTDRDEVNLMACWLAKRAGVKRVLSRVRDLEFTDTPAWAHELGIDVMSSPERSLSREIENLLVLNAAVHTTELTNSKAGSYAFWVEKNSQICGLSLKEVGMRWPDLGAVMVYVERSGVGAVPSGDWVAEPNDLCFFVCLQDKVLLLQSLFHHSVHRQLSRVLIVGGGKLGTNLAGHLCLRYPRNDIVIIDSNMAKCERLAAEYPKVAIINGDGFDEKLLRQEGVDGADGVVSATGNDEMNVMISILAKKLGARKTISVVRKKVYHTMEADLPVDVLLNPNDALASVFLRHIRYPQSAGVLSLIDRIGAEMLEFVLSRDNPVVGRRIMDLQLPKGVLIAMINRCGEAVVPHGSDVLEAGDVISLFAMHDLMSRASRILGVEA